MLLLKLMLLVPFVVQQPQAPLNERQRFCNPDYEYLLYEEPQITDCKPIQEVIPCDDCDLAGYPAFKARCTQIL